MKRENIKPTLRYIGISAMIYILFLSILPRKGHGADFWCWSRWATYIYEHGLGNVYDSGTDYLPLYHYVLFLFGKLQDSAEEIKQNIHYLKAFSLVFHFISGYFLFRLVRSGTNKNWDNVLLHTMFYVLNIAVLYNTIIWGQVDAILTCFIFLCFYFAYQKKVLTSIIFYALAISFKLQAIVFFPVIGLMLLPEMISQFSIKKIVVWILAPVLLVAIISLPFILTGAWPKVWHVVTNSSNKYPVVSMNAFNIWHILVKGDLMKIPDSTLALGASYKAWGLLMFMATSAAALFPLLKSSFGQIAKKTIDRIDMEKLLIILALIPLLFFYFNTQMHERYSHPTMIFILAYAIIQKKPGIAIIACLTYFLNLERVFKFLEVAHGTFIFFKDLIASLYLFVILRLFIDLYGIKVFGSKKQHQVINS